MTASVGRLATALADRYRIEREIGQGGMATVYLAQDLRHDRKVAIKVLRPELAAVIGAERFLIEIRTTANLQHSHILPLHDSGEAGSFLYYVMPFVEGESLRDRLTREKQLSIPEAVRIATEVAGALDYAHRHGVIHRDIKPENILLHDGRALVADFGIALAASKASGSRMTETGMSLGTPHYMSPEQATGERDITGRSDVYAIGAVLYEMLLGEPPFTGPTTQAIIAKLVTTEPPSLIPQRKSIPPAVEAAVLTALEKLPADRFESAKAFADALANQTFTATSSTRAHLRPGPRGVSPRVFGATLAVALMALVAALLGWLRPAPRAEVVRLAIALPDSQAMGSTSGFGVLRLALSPDGRTIVYSGAGGSAATSHLWVRRLDDLRATSLPGTEGGSNPSFSPDGRRVAFIAGSPRALKTIALAGGPPITLTDSLVDAGGVSWGHDGYIYYDGHLAGDGVARVRETGGSPEVASLPDSAAGESWHSSPSALPNGKGILFSIAHLRGQGEWEVGVLDTRTGKHKVLVNAVQARYATSGHLLYVTFDGSLMAAPFDQNKLEITGSAVLVAEGLVVRGLGRSDVEVSANGTLIYVAGPTGGRTRELVWVNRQGLATSVDSTWSGSLIGRPALSPDGRSALVTMSPGGLPQVWVKHLDRGPASKLVDAANSPTWAPDGKTFLFTTPQGGGRGPADGSVLPAEFRTSSSLITPEYSPDGRWIVYSSQGNLFIMSTSGDSGARALLPPSSATESRPLISPDGRWLAYISDESGRTEAYVRPFPQTAVAKHQVSTEGGLVARWSRDGHELFLLDDRRDLVAVPVTLAPSFSTGIPRRLFATAAFDMPIYGFDVSPDGKRFLMTRQVGGESRPDELVLVQNFFEELRAKVGKK